MFLRLKVSEAAVNTEMTSAGVLRAASRPFWLGTSTSAVTSAGFRISAMTSSVPAIWGTHFGDTKLPASIRRWPAATRALNHSARWAGDTGVFSFCSPSRKPTSTSVT